MTKKMSKTARDYHLRTGGNNCCPYCKAEIYHAGEYEEMEPVEDGNVEQTVICLKCNRRWTDVYTLTDVRELCSTRPSFEWKDGEPHLSGCYLFELTTGIFLVVEARWTGTPRTESHQLVYACASHPDKFGGVGDPIKRHLRIPDNSRIAKHD